MSQRIELTGLAKIVLEDALKRMRVAPVNVRDGLKKEVVSVIKEWHDLGYDLKPYVKEYRAILQMYKEG